MYSFRVIQYTLYHTIHLHVKKLSDLMNTMYTYMATLICEYKT